MTSREYFDLLCHTSRSGKFPAVNTTKDGKDFCRYRTSDGRACAVGLLIPDDVYHTHGTDMEGLSLTSADPESIAACVRPYIPAGLTLADLDMIQDLHDTSAVHRIPWDHARFVRGLTANVPAFAGFTDHTETTETPQ